MLGILYRCVRITEVSYSMTQTTIPDDVTAQAAELERILRSEIRIAGRIKKVEATLQSEIEDPRGTGANPAQSDFCLVIYTDTELSGHLSRFPHSYGIYKVYTRPLPSPAQALR